MPEGSIIGTYKVPRFLMGICIIFLLNCIGEVIYDFISRKIQKRKEILENEKRSNN